MKGYLVNEKRVTGEFEEKFLLLLTSYRNAFSLRLAFNFPKIEINNLKVQEFLQSAFVPLIEKD